MNDKDSGKDKGSIPKEVEFAHAFSTQQADVGALLVGSEFKAFARKLFNQMQSLLGARAGYVGILSEDGLRNDLLFLEPGGLPCGVPHDLPMPMRGFREEARLEGRAKAENDFPNTHWAALLPRGHVTVDNVLFVPFRSGERIVGLIGLANKPGGFTDEDLRLAEVYAQMAGLQVENLIMQGELRESEARHRTVVEESPNAIMVVKDGRYVYVNPAGLRAVGITRPEQILGHRAFDFIDAEHHQALLTRMEKVDAGDGNPPLELGFLRPDGSRIFFESVSAPITWAGGPAALVIGREVTDQKRSQQLSQSLHQLALSLASTSSLDEALSRCLDTALAVTGLETGVIHLMTEHGSLELAEWRGLSERSLELIRTYPSGSPHERLIRSGKAVYLPYQQLGLSDGEIGRVEGIKSVAVVPVMHQGRPLAVISLASRRFEEFTSPFRETIETIAYQIGAVLVRLRAAEQLRASEEKFATIFHLSPNAVSISRAQTGEFIEVNQMFVDLSGFAREEIIGHTWRELGLVKAMPQRERMARIREANGIVTNFEITIVTKDGNEIQVLTSSQPFNFQGEPCVLTIASDVSDLKKLEQEIIKSTKLESVGTLAGGIAHDFNNLLFGVMGNLALAKLRLKGFEDGYELLEEAEGACNRAVSLTRQLLTFAKGGEPVKATASIEEILRESASFVLRGSNVRARFQFPPGLWPAEIDAGQIYHVFNNLIINAKQAMPNGGEVEISAANHTAGPAPRPGLIERDYVLIRVADHGPGIPREIQGRIFDPFFTTKDKGSGLGLATAYSIINKHEGLITVDSATGQGTEMTIYLPASHQPETAVILPETKMPRAFPGKRILVMDDEEYIRTLSERLLGKLGCEVVTAEEGEQAVEIFRAAEQPFDAVILDLTVPGGMGGRQAMEALREIDPQVKAIVASGYSNDPVLSNFQDYGFSGVIAKPYGLNDLASALTKLFED